MNDTVVRWKGEVIWKFLPGEVTYPNDKQLSKYQDLPYTWWVEKDISSGHENTHMELQ